MIIMFGLFAAKQPCRRVLSMFFVVIVLVLVLFVSSCSVECSQQKQQQQAPPGRIYNLTSGLYKPVEMKIYNRTVHKLIGIPYASRPNAFEKSQPFLVAKQRTSSATLVADTWPALCIQAAVFNHKHYGNFKLSQKFEMSFDCLTISVYVPVVQPAEEDASKPPPLLSAMLFVHGGSNAAGSSTYLDGSALASFGNVVVALLNYRLDLTGFFSLPESGVHGNYGLWDQLNALKWLHANCRELGCDPASITIFGHSAGSGDIMLLSQSPLAKPYIKRLIMQSGSGLAHWAINYENHVVHELKRKLQAEYDAQPASANLNLNKKGLELIRQVNHDQSKYISSLNDSLGNFISATTCNLTKKFDCLVYNLRKYLQFGDAEFAGLFNRNTFKYIDHELRLRKAFWDICKRSNINDFQYTMGYLHKLLIHDASWSEKAIESLDAVMAGEEEMLNAQTHKLISGGAALNASMDRMWRSMVNLDDDENLFSQDEYFYYNHDPCYTHFFYFIQNAKTIKHICKFIHDFQFQVNWPSEQTNGAVVKLPYLLVSPTLRPFLRCFTRAYIRSEASLMRKREPSLVDFLLMYDYRTVIDEMKLCTSQAAHNTYRVELKKFKLNLDEYFLNFTMLNKIYENKNKTRYLASSNTSLTSENYELRKQVFNEIRNQVLDYQLTMRSVYELAMLTENPNHLHKASVDGELITQMPHASLLADPLASSQYDVMVGVTSHESFYFLDHAFNLTDILKHAFVYASLINTTDNLIDKLVRVVNSKGLRLCLKRELFNFYNIKMTRAESKSNSIERNVRSLELISDVDFYLPLITQLKHKMEAENLTTSASFSNQSNNNSSSSKYFVYKYSYHSSFNYMLSELKAYYKIFEAAYTHFNKSVVPHFSELDYVFGLPILSKLNLVEFKDQHVHNYNYTDREFNLSMVMMQYWTNFAKHGDPNIRHLDSSSQYPRPKASWPAFEGASPPIMDIDSDEPKANHKLIQSWLAKHKFWYEDLPNALYDECLLTSSAPQLFVSISSKNAFILAALIISWTLCF